MHLSLGHDWDTVGHFGIRTYQDGATFRATGRTADRFAVPPAPTFEHGKQASPPPDGIGQKRGRMVQQHRPTPDRNAT
jgi:hypothetical protein